jgi:hypothetical protein
MLQDRMGIDSEIANYFANERAVPVNNAFWKNKRIYVSTGFAYLCIPVLSDLLLKLGIDKSVILSESHIKLTEDIFDRSVQYEFKQITFPNFVNECNLLLSGKIKQLNLVEDLNTVLIEKKSKHFRFETKLQSLARCDGYLYSFADLDTSDEWVKQFLTYWYTIMRPILLIDDFQDLLLDRVNGEENAIIELGDYATGIQSAYNLGVKDLKLLAEINPKFSAFMASTLKNVLTMRHIESELRGIN